MIGQNLRGINRKSVIKTIEFSVFIDDSGPSPIYCYPNTLDPTYQMNIAMKSISLLMGEGMYQSGYDSDALKYFGILPFPDIGMSGLTYFFLIKDESVRGKAKAATITVLVNEQDSKFLYENIKTLRVLMDRTALKFTADTTKKETENIMETLREELINFDETDPSSSRLTKKIKMVFTGLDNAGKTSFLKSVEKRYSELMGITPTRGLERREKELFGTTLLEWDFAGQSNYRINYFKNAEIFLTDIDMLFYIIDVQDDKRVEEAQSYLHQILTTLENFKEYPPLIIIFHKADPDLSLHPEITDRIDTMKENFEKDYKKWLIRYFNTTIFDHWTIVSAFSYGISQLSPNREIFRNSLKWITKRMGGDASLLLNKNAIILSDYSENWSTGRFFETSQAYFYNIFIRFEEFGMLERDYITWEVNGIKILLKRFKMSEKEFYLLIQIKDQKSLEKLDEYLEKFKVRIRPLIKNYI